MTASSEERSESARRFLADAGFPSARVDVDGIDGELAVLHLGDADRGGVLAERDRISRGLTSFGFRYVTLALAAE